jgi:murein hydrolase activator
MKFFKDFFFTLTFFSFVAPQALWAAPQSAQQISSQQGVQTGTQSSFRKSSESLEEVRERIFGLEEALLTSLKSQTNAHERVQKLKGLKALHQEEQDLARKRMDQLRTVIGHLETRKKDLSSRLHDQKGQIHSYLKNIDLFSRNLVPVAIDQDYRKIRHPKRYVVSKMTQKSLSKLEALFADLLDVNELEHRIEEERAELAYLLEDLNERMELLSFHQRLQTEVLQESFESRVVQLEKYQRLKRSESQVEDLVSQFNARLEFEKLEKIENQISRSIFQGDFLNQKGHLPMPASGTIIGSYGRYFDSSTRLNIFRKGIEIDVGQGKNVQAIFAGKVAYVGILPGYGNVAIIDHGAQYYSLCARLGRIDVKAGDLIRQGAVIGATQEGEGTLYFEIRLRNVPVNPLQWISI